VTAAKVAHMLLESIVPVNKDIFIKKITFQLREDKYSHDFEQRSRVRL
jgi:hypothetical protein